MIRGSLILCDSNICIYRTLSLIEPKILGADHLDKTTKMIADLTNNNLACKIIIMDVVNSEVQSDEILFECINDFCTNKLHWRPNSFKIQQVFIKAKKSIHKFLDNRLVSGEILGKINKFRQQLTKVDSFYLKYPARLQKVTDNKIRYLKLFDKQRKLKQRPNNLPEENDRLLLCQALELKQELKENVCIFTNDSDFLEFRLELKSELGIDVIGIEDIIQS